MTSDLISATEYIAAMTKAGYFSEDSKIPELNPKVWNTYFKILAEYGHDMKDLPVKLCYGRYGFFLDTLDDERKGWNWALCTPMVDPIIPATVEQFFSDLPDIIQSLGNTTVATDSFSFFDGYPKDHIKSKNIVYLNSPVATINPSFEKYIEGLSQERRKKFRRMERDFELLPITFEFSGSPLHDTEINFGWENLQKKWGSEGALYAFGQTIWTKAIAEIYPDKVFVMRVQESGKLIFIQTMIGRHGGLYAQSIFKDEGVFHDGIAPYTDFQTIRAITGSSFSFFDPSCRTGLDDPETIGIAKRVTVNTNVLKPLFIYGENFPESYKAVMMSGEVQGKPV